MIAPDEMPIGIFDSGVGGLSVLRHIQLQLPYEHLVYFADSGFAPYGDKPEAVIVARSLAIAEFLLQQGAKALVVACNTATAAAIKGLRERYCSVPVVGVEPGLKPAAAHSKNQLIGVLATDRTLNSTKFNLLREQVSAATGSQFLLQACIGLADQIETGDLQSSVIEALVQSYVAPLIARDVDTLVLGCTHYPFIRPLIESLIERSGKNIQLIDTGEPVARHLARRLAEHGLQRSMGGRVQLTAYTSASPAALDAAFLALLGIPTTARFMAPTQTTFQLG
ncbi:MAG: glutamate racemase [Pseudomonadota bacterium]